TESLLYGSFEWRSIEGIVQEFEKLRSIGVKAIRFGRSSNVVATDMTGAEADLILRSPKSCSSQPERYLSLRCFT
ncbi:MAG: hypothetical protein PHX36_07680, partial [Mesotoga sp.]